MPDVIIDTDLCTGCSTCVDSCPLELFIIEEDVATVADAAACMECGYCETECPIGAIQVS